MVIGSWNKNKTCRTNSKILHLKETFPKLKGSEFSMKLSNFNVKIESLLSKKKTKAKRTWCIFCLPKNKLFYGAIIRDRAKDGRTLRK